MYCIEFVQDGEVVVDYGGCYFYAFHRYLLWLCKVGDFSLISVIFAKYRKMTEYGNC